MSGANLAVRLPGAGAQHHPTVTIVVPNRNHGHFLPESLGSIAVQTHPADEVIVIDDDSTDDSVRIIEEFVRERRTWRTIRRTERKGVVAALNDGIAAARGEWIAFLGADDLLQPTFLEKVLHHAALTPAQLVCGCAAILGGASSRAIRPVILPSTQAGYLSAEKVRKLLLTSDNFFVGTVVLYRREALVEFKGFDPQLGALTDGFLARRLALRFGLSFIPEVLGYWRVHGENYSVTVASDVAEVERILARAHEVLAAEPPGVFPPGYDRILDRRLRFACARLVALALSAPAEPRADTVANLLHAGAAERRTLRAMMACGRAGSLAVLGWLTVRFRPYSLTRLAVEPLRRRAARVTSRPDAVPGCVEQSNMSTAAVRPDKIT